MTDTELFEQLTPREREYARYLLEGADCTDREIAAAMSISHRSVRRYATALFDITGADNRTALAVRLMRRPGLLKLLGVTGAD